MGPSMLVPVPSVLGCEASPSLAAVYLVIPRIEHVSEAYTFNLRRVLVPRLLI
jgi:hypothetical protein